MSQRIGSMGRIEAVAWDYDGTIGQTGKRQFEWLNHWAKENGKPALPFRDVGEFMPFYNEHCGKDGGVQNVYDALGLPCDMDRKSNHPVWAAYEKYKQQHPAKLYPGIKRAVLDIWEMGHLTSDPNRNKRIRLGINTTNTWHSVYQDLKKAKISHCFDCHVTEETLRKYQGTGDPNAIHKPSPISLALILGLIDSEGEFMVHIGDTLNDLAASQKVIRLNPSRPETLITIGAAWGYEGRKKLEQGVQVDGKTVHFDYIRDHPRELPLLIRQLIKAA